MSAAFLSQLEEEEEEEYDSDYSDEEEEPLTYDGDSIEELDPGVATFSDDEELEIDVHEKQEKGI